LIEVILFKDASNFCDHIASVLDEYNEHGALMKWYRGILKYKEKDLPRHRNGFATNWLKHCTAYVLHDIISWPFLFYEFCH